MAKHQKNKDPERWLLHNRNGRGPSAATAAVFRAESEGRGLPGADAPQSLGPGGRKLKTVDSGMDGLFDEEEDKPTRRKKRHAGEGDMDEMEYEEDFADDEEKVDDDNDDEEAKELEVRNFRKSLFRS
jgi:transcription initiation factor TFIIF subunit alpha